MHTTLMVPLMMFGWLPFVVWMFGIFDAPHRAALCGFLLAWMFLPVYGYHLPALPTYDKIGAASYGVLIGAAIHDPTVFRRFSPHACDLPVALWCVASMCSSISNNLGVYDGGSAMLAKIVAWGIPYFIGRIYFDNTSALRDLCLGLFAGAVAYIPFCWVEFVISPRLHKIVYGWHPGNFGQTKRSGGWRPVVFMKHGLMCAMWMATGAVAGIRLWQARAIPKHIFRVGIHTGTVVAGLVLTLVLCKSFGALVLMILGGALILLVSRMRMMLPVVCLCVLPSVYMVARGSGWWDAENLIAASLAISNEERSESLAFRIKNENVLIGKALERPMFGWAGWKRSFIFNANGVAVSVPDGLWIVAFGQNGLFGLFALTLTLLLPQLLFLRMFPPSMWRETAVAAIVPLSILLGLFMIDNLFNDMFNPAMLLSAGGLTGLYIRHSKGEPLLGRQPRIGLPRESQPRLL
jgi:hypothetical protein